MNARLTGLGACREVGRSSFVLDIGEKILLDRGIKLSPEGTYYPMEIKTRIDAVVLSHAHIDHSGHFPHLFLKENPLCYMTAPTLDIAEILWHDTLKICGLEGTDCHFTKEEIERARRYTFQLHYGREIDITKNASLQFLDAGHILGSALTKIFFKDKSLLYTGDYKVNQTRLQKPCDLSGGQVDYVITESTYGNRNHPDRKKSEFLFVEKAKEAVESGGFALIPAFAVGRSQEVIEVLVENKFPYPIYLDGMGTRVAKIYLEHPDYLSEPKRLKKALKRTHWIKNNKNRKMALEEPCAIVTTAGMLEGGPIMHYLKKMHADENTKVLMTGFQVPETPGDKLLKTNKIEIDGTEYQVKGDVMKFDFSAHASQDGMLNALKKWSPEKVVLVHGDAQVMADFKTKIVEDLGLSVEMPETGKTIDLG